MSEMQCVNNLVSALKQWQKPYATIVRPYKHTEYKGALSMQMNNTWSLILLFDLDPNLFLFLFELETFGS